MINIGSLHFLMFMFHYVHADLSTTLSMKAWNGLVSATQTFLLTINVIYQFVRKQILYFYCFSLTKSDASGIRWKSKAICMLAVAAWIFVTFTNCSEQSKLQILVLHRKKLILGKKKSEKLVSQSLQWTFPVPMFIKPPFKKNCFEKDLNSLIRP